jgi:hypothetical protein
MRFTLNSVALKRIVTVSSVVLASALLTACATPTTSQGMTPTAIQTTTKHAKSVSLDVSGGQDTSSMGKSQISSEAYAKALTDAINASKTFSSVIQGKGGDYLLTVTLFNIDQPSFGGAFTVKLEAGWQLQRADNGAIVWQESIKSEHTATMGDAFVGVERLRLATEGAARNNIAQGLAKVSALKL